MMDLSPTHLQAEELAEHDRFVIALARRLLRDPDAALDTAQDAWAVALTRDRPGHVSLRSWLAGIVRNLVCNRRRALARRERLDAFIPTPEGPETADAWVLRTEMEQRILRAVLDLDSAIRNCVLLRFREGLTSKGISERLRIPEGTARWRIHRGISLVRAQLDEEHGGDREAWLAGVAGVAGRLETAGVLPAVGGMLIMKLKVSVAVATIALLSLALWTRSEDGEEVAPGVVAALRPVEEAPVEGLVPPERTPLVDARVEEPVEQRVLHLSGRCVTQSGEPLGGVKVAYLNLQQADPRWGEEGHEDGHVLSDPDGSFAIEANFDVGANPKAPGALRTRFALTDSTAPEHAIRFSRDDVVTRLLSTFGLSSGNRDRADFGEVVLEPASWVSGRVLDGEGRPIAGAKVISRTNLELRAFWRNDVPSASGAMITDHEGRFVVAGLKPDWTRLLAFADGYFAGACEPLGLLPSQPMTGITIRLPPVNGRVIEGVALDASGTPLAGVRVQQHQSFDGSSRLGSVLTDDEGRFSAKAFNPVPQTFRLQVDGAVAKANEVWPGTTDLELRLPSVPKMTLEIRDGSTGLPPSTCTVIVQHPEGHGYHDRVDLPKATPPPNVPDSVEVAVPHEPFVIIIYAPGYFPFTSETYDPAQVTATPLHLTIHPNPRITGGVTHAGSPVEDAVVSVMTTSNQLYSGFAVRARPSALEEYTARTGANGRFELPAPTMGLPSNDEDPILYLRAEAPNLAATTIGPFRASELSATDPLHIGLTEGGSIEGTLLGADGRPAPGRIIAASNADGVPRFTHTGVKGAYVLRHLTPGRWQIEPRTTDYDWFLGKSLGYPKNAELPSNCSVDEGQVTRFDLSSDAQTRCVLSGAVPFGRGRPGLSVALYECLDPSPWPVSPGDPRRHEAIREKSRVRGYRVIGTNGVVTAVDVRPDGSYQLEANAPGTYVAVLSNELLTGPGSMWKKAEIEALVDLVPGEVTLDFGSGFGEIRRLPTEPGKVSDRGYGDRIDWVAPISSRMRGVGCRNANADGSFVLETVPAGVVYVRSGGDWMPVEVIAGESVAVDLR